MSFRLREVKKETAGQLSQCHLTCCEQKRKTKIKGAFLQLTGHLTGCY